MRDILKIQERINYSQGKRCRDKRRKDECLGRREVGPNNKYKELI